MRYTTNVPPAPRRDRAEEQARAVIKREQRLSDEERALELDLAIALGEAREKARIGLGTLAADLGVTNPALWRWEAEGRLPSTLGQLLRWAGRVGLDLKIELKDRSGSVICGDSTRARGWRPLPATDTRHEIKAGRVGGHNANEV